MSTDDNIPPKSSGPAPLAANSPEGWILGGMTALLIGGAIAFLVLRGTVSSVPPEVAKDPLLNQGHTIYQARCVTCHGLEGKGDGPIAKNLIGPPPGNLTDAEWKHGSNPDQVIQVIADGVKNTRMEGWGKVLDPADLRATAAYVYYLARLPVPEKLRTP